MPFQGQLYLALITEEWEMNFFHAIILARNYEIPKVLYGEFLKLP